MRRSVGTYSAINVLQTTYSAPSPQRRDEAEHRELSDVVCDPSAAVPAENDEDRPYHRTYAPEAIGSPSPVNSADGHASQRDTTERTRFDIRQSEFLF